MFLFFTNYQSQLKDFIDSITKLVRHLKNVFRKVVIVIIVKHFNAKFKDTYPCESFKKCAHGKAFKILEKTEGVTQMCSIKKWFLKISIN